MDQGGRRLHAILFPRSGQIPRPASRADRIRNYLGGECEIGAWEVASGCGTYATAWFLSLSVLALGLFINPKGVNSAFLRGSQSSNLYGIPFDAKLLTSKVGDVRRQLDLNKPLLSKCLRVQ